MDVIEWLDEKELENVKEDRDPADAPTLPSYIRIQPENQGKVLWFSGPPGAGKSTTAQLMAKTHGYVYYEADCLSIFTNPFIDIHTPNPSMAQMNQKPLKGVTKETLKVVDARSEMMATMDEEFKGNEGMFKAITTIANMTAEDIKKHKARIGGDWAVAFAVSSREQRDFLRKIFGTSLYFVVLNITQECNMKRLKKRHGEENTKEMSKMFDKILEKFKPADDDEERAFNITISEDMTPEDVLKKVESAIQNI